MRGVDRDVGGVGRHAAQEAKEQFCGERPEEPEEHEAEGSSDATQAALVRSAVARQSPIPANHAEDHRPEGGDERTQRHVGERQHAKVAVGINRDERERNRPIEERGEE